MMFHINNYVRIKLTDYGREILHNRFEDRLHKRYPEVFTESMIPKDDDEGWSRWSLWDLMNTFGDYVGLGMEVPFDTVIEILE